MRYGEPIRVGRCSTIIELTRTGKLAGVAAVLAIAAGAGAYALIGATTPQALGLPSPVAKTPAPSPSPDDPLAAACRRPAAPPGPSPAVAAGPAGLWVVQPGSLAGYRAHEKFEELPSPHVAVGRTDRVSGWLVVTVQGGVVSLGSSCVAVDLASLRSIDKLPGFNTADRDNSVRDFLHTSEHPFAVFRVNGAPVGSAPAGATPVHVRVTGTLELNGMMRPLAFNLVVRLDGEQVSAAGNTTVGVRDYGIDVPQGASGFVSVDPRITLEISLVLLRQ